MIRPATVTPPNTGVPPYWAVVTPRRLAERLNRLGAALRGTDLDAVVVYADRKHSAHLEFLTRVAARFEEALLEVTANGHRRMPTSGGR